MNGNPVHQPIEEVHVVSAASKEDWWSLYDLECSGEIHTESPYRFLNFLLSPSTSMAKIEAYDIGRARIRLIGPRCCDGEWLEMVASVTAESIHLALKPTEKTALLARLLELWGPAYSPGSPLTLVKNSLKL